MDQGKLEISTTFVPADDLTHEGLHWKYESAAALGSHPREIITHLYYIISAIPPLTHARLVLYLRGLFVTSSPSQ